MLLGDTPSAGLRVPASLRELEDMRRACVQWVACPLYCVEPALDPAVGGNPDMTGRPMVRFVGVGEAWAEVFGPAALDQIMIVAASEERLDALEALADGDEELEEAVRYCKLSDAERILWTALSPTEWPSGIKPPASKLSRADWLVRESAIRLRDQELSRNLIEAARAIYTSLGVRDGDVPASRRELGSDSVLTMQAKRAAEQARWRDHQKEAAAHYSGTSVGDAMVEALFTHARPTAKRMQRET
jgi:hypothetical protein